MFPYLLRRLPVRGTQTGADTHRQTDANTEETKGSFEICEDFVAGSIDKPFSMKELKTSVKKALDMQKVRNG